MFSRAVVTAALLTGVVTSGMVTWQPGNYVTSVRGRGMGITETVDRASQIIGTLQEQTLIAIVEVAVREDQGRVRGRIEHPIPGWISLEALDLGKVFVQKVATAPVFLSADSEFLQYRGRFDHIREGARFDMPGCEIRFRVQGATSVKAYIAQAMGPLIGFEGEEPLRSEFVAFVDGVPIPPEPRTWCSLSEQGCTFDTSDARNGTVQAYTIATDLGPGEHEVRLVKTTEPAWDADPNWVMFSGVELDGGTALPPPVRPTKRIEFIGDSTTTGYCNKCRETTPASSIQVSTMQVDWTEPGYWQSAKRGAHGESFVSAWASMTCEGLDAECHTTAWSGMGLTSTCCNDSTVREDAAAMGHMEDVFNIDWSNRDCCSSPAEKPLTLDRVWKRTVATDAATRWDHSSWIPDALVINVGMNDGWRVNTCEWENTYINLLANASEMYGGKLDIFLACGPVTGQYCPAVQKVVTRSRERGINTHFLDQRSFLNGTYGGSCCGHPSQEVGMEMARAAVSEIRAQMGWDGATIPQDPTSRFDCTAHNGPSCEWGLLEMVNSVRRPFAKI